MIRHMRNTEQLINANENQDLVIDCGTCVIKDSNMCKECVVTFICNRDPGEALVIDLEEAVEHEAGIV